MLDFERQWKDLAFPRWHRCVQDGVFVGSSLKKIFDRENDDADEFKRSLNVSLTLDGRRCPSVILWLIRYGLPIYCDDFGNGDKISLCLIMNGSLSDNRSIAFGALQKLDAILWNTHRVLFDIGEEIKAIFVATNT